MAVVPSDAADVDRAVHPSGIVPTLQVRRHASCIKASHQQPHRYGCTSAHGVMPGCLPLQNIVATVNLDTKLDLKTIALTARNAEYNPKVGLTHVCEGSFDRNIVRERGGK